jgi:hypothetical protein
LRLRRGWSSSEAPAIIGRGWFGLDASHGADLADPVLVSTWDELGDPALGETVAVRTFEEGEHLEQLVVVEVAELFREIWNQFRSLCC